MKGIKLLPNERKADYENVVRNWTRAFLGSISGAHTLFSSKSAPLTIYSNNVQSRSFDHFLIGETVHERRTDKIASTVEEKII